MAIISLQFYHYEAIKNQIHYHPQAQVGHHFMEAAIALNDN